MKDTINDVWMEWTLDQLYCATFFKAATPEMEEYCSGKPDPFDAICAYEDELSKVDLVGRLTRLGVSLDRICNGIEVFDATRFAYFRS